MNSKEEIIDKAKHEEKFELIIKEPNRNPEKFPEGFSVKENIERIERIFSETQKSGAAIHIRGDGRASRFSMS